MKIQDQLSDKDKEKLDVKKEKLTDRDMKELMGTNRQTYKRHRGAMRRK